MKINKHIRHVILTSNYMEKYRCKRCGYEGKQISDIKQHYRKKKPCEAKYCDLSYDILLDLLNKGEHGDIKNTVSTRTLPNSFKIGDSYEGADGQIYTIENMYLIPDVDSDEAFLAAIKKSIEALKISERFCPESNVNIVFTPENTVLLLH